MATEAEMTANSQTGSPPPNLPMATDAAPSHWPTVASWDVPPEEGGVSLRDFMHALRRRWIVGLVLGLALAAVIGTTMWFAIPIQYEVAADIHIKSSEDRLLPTASVRSRGLYYAEDYDIFRQTQVALIRSPYVLSAALRKPGVSQLPLLAREENQVSWLQNNIGATYPNNAEILRISMRGQQPEHLVKLVNAVKDAYLEETVHAHRSELLKRLEELRKENARGSEQISASRKEIHRLETQMGTTNSMQAKLRQQLELESLASLAKSLRDVEARLHDVSLKVALLETSTGGSSRVEVPGYLIDEHLDLDGRYVQLKQEVQLAQQRFSLVASAGKPGSSGVRRAEGSLRSAQQLLATRRRQLEDRIARKLRDQMSGQGDQQHKLSLLRTERDLLRKRYSELNEIHQQQLQYVNQLDDVSVALETKRQELHQQLATNEAVQSEIRDLDVQLMSPPRIREIQEARFPNTTNMMLKYLQIAVATLAALSLTLGGLAFWDAQSRRINGAGDFCSSTRLTVLGGIPQLSGRRPQSVWPFHQLSDEDFHMILADAVDSVRTALMRACAGNTDGSVIMVSSAIGHEGKTTLASQLAVSFARSGRRTLLVDGDTRNPQQHAVFALPDQRGLSEVLRQEMELEAAVQSSGLLELHVLAGGNCDVRSLRALSNESIRMIVDQLRQEYEFIVVDTPPVLTNTEPLLLGQMANATVLSARRDVSQKNKVCEARDRLQAVGIPVLGVVVSGAMSEVRRSGLRSGQPLLNEAHSNPSPAG